MTAFNSSSTPGMRAGLLGALLIAPVRVSRGIAEVIGSSIVMDIASDWLPNSSDFQLMPSLRFSLLSWRAPLVFLNRLLSTNTPESPRGNFPRHPAQAPACNLPVARLLHSLPPAAHPCRASSTSHRFPLVRVAQALAHAEAARSRAPAGGGVALSIGHRPWRIHKRE